MVVIEYFVPTLGRAGSRAQRCLNTFNGSCSASRRQNEPCAVLAAGFLHHVCSRQGALEADYLPNDRRPFWYHPRFSMLKGREVGGFP